MNSFKLLDIFRILVSKTKSAIWQLKVHQRRTLFILACNGPAKFWAKSAVDRFNWQPIVLRNLNDFFDESFTLFKSSPSTMAAPGFNGKNGSISTREYSPLRAYVLQEKDRKIIATTYSSAVIWDNKLLLPSHLIHSWMRVKTDSGGLFDSGDKFCVGRSKAATEIKEGILIGGAGAFNWYHFVVEILPKAFLSKFLPPQYDGLPLLVPDECQRLASFTAALEIFSGERPLRFVKSGELISLQRLIVFDEISIGPFNLTPGEWPRTDDYAHHDLFLRCFIQEFRSKILESGTHKVKGKSTKGRIFLTRPGLRRNFNQGELLEISLRYGFEPFSPEECTLHEQAKIFSEASAIIGPSGAAWVGMIFREAPLRGLTWLPREYENFCGYSGLANLLGHRLDFIEAKTPRALSSTGEAYVTDYQVCPIQFEAALRIMIGENQ